MSFQYKLQQMTLQSALSISLFFLPSSFCQPIKFTTLLFPIYLINTMVLSRSVFAIMLQHLYDVCFSNILPYITSLWQFLKIALRVIYGILLERFLFLLFEHSGLCD